MVGNEIKYLIKLEEGQVSQLRNVREHDADSSLFGVVKEQDTEGLFFVLCASAAFSREKE
ncbi:MAG: hypothetical protein HUJ51_04030 [Eggerthellaceae bacterium]|nr:hypothetical protein [Eggerthellaceae bacterium]